MLVACRLAGLSALETYYAGVRAWRAILANAALPQFAESQTGSGDVGLARFTTCAPMPARRSSTPRPASKTYMRGCRSEWRFGP